MEVNGNQASGANQGNQATQNPDLQDNLAATVIEPEIEPSRRWY